MSWPGRKAGGGRRIHDVQDLHAAEHDLVGDVTDGRGVAAHQREHVLFRGHLCGWRGLAREHHLLPVLLDRGRRAKVDVARERVTRGGILREVHGDRGPAVRPSRLFFRKSRETIDRCRVSVGFSGDDDHPVPRLFELAGGWHGQGKPPDNEDDPTATCESPVHLKLEDRTLPRRRPPPPSGRGARGLRARGVGLEQLEDQVARPAARGRCGTGPPTAAGAGCPWPGPAPPACGWPSRSRRSPTTRGRGAPSAGTRGGCCASPRPRRRGRPTSRFVEPSGVS